MLSMEEIAARLAQVRGQITDAAGRAGRPAESVRLILASKTQPPAALRSAYRAGAREFGENYVQEAVAKRDALPEMRDARWHLIGHLQSNKAKLAVDAFDLIQTLDSVRLAETLARLRPSPPMAVLIEVNLGGESSKSGIAPDRVESLIEAARAKVEIRGLMTIPPVEGPQSARHYFAQLRQMRERLAAASGLALSELSMGMTEDFVEAIEEGATIVRVGRAVFGERVQ